jgi:two-component system chemotaxis sensor kinase CheA
VRGPRISSVAAKLAGATLALIALVTAGIYLQLSHYQRENLLHAKTLSASAVTRLFADSCAPAVVYDDPNDLRDTLATLGRNDDVEYAAVWSADESGRATRRLAELGRGHPIMGVVPGTLQLRRDSDRVVLVAPVRDIRHKMVGGLVVAFSLAPENAAIARLERTTLLISAIVGLGLAALLMAMARVVVVGPLAKLALAARRVGEGRAVEIEVRSDDEVGQLAGALRTMASAIQVREERIQARNQDMRLVLDHAGQGFITLDLAGMISEERSRIVDEWFGPIAAGTKIWDCLRRFDVALGDYLEVGWSAVVEQYLPIDLCLDQLPKLVVKDRRTFELAYQPTFKGEALDKTIVVITDITMRLERERSDQRQRETMKIFRRLHADRPAFEEFFSEATALVRAIVDTPYAPLSTIRRQVHTLKGNCALFGVESVALLCHAIEDRLDDAATLLDDDRARLRDAWRTATATRAALVETGLEARVAVAREDYDQLLDDLRRHVDPEALIAAVESWEYEPAVKRLALLREQIERLAERLGKAPVDVVTAPTELRLPPDNWAGFWSAFAHVVRNTVDHGVETAEQRSAAGKPARARIELGITQERGQLLISIQDDGPGIDWQTVAVRARERGLPCETQRDLEAALFTDGLSTRGQAGATSGRGVGLGAVRDVVTACGGRLELGAVAGTGTWMRCWLPASMLTTPKANSAKTVVAAPLPMDRNHSLNRPLNDSLKNARTDAPAPRRTPSGHDLP